MSNRYKQNSVTRLSHDGWVTLYDPLTPRREWAGEADGMNEFSQRPSDQYMYGEHYRTHEQVIGGTVIEKWIDPDKPWKGVK